MAFSPEILDDDTTSKISMTMMINWEAVDIPLNMSRVMVETNRRSDRPLAWTQRLITRVACNLFLYIYLDECGNLEEEEDEYDKVAEDREIHSGCWCNATSDRMLALLMIVLLEGKVELKEKLSRVLVKDPNAIFVFKFWTHFGRGKSTGFGLIYDSVENAKKYEP
ncbi:40S ribosomal protein S24-2 [Camellia lanceoleosa]|uniref:40S ribosomal protein S24-2 n=1 Tax=Camellia lanceoleosa TaxID=1840588 RepID=A0ACC0FJ61_9ERIC|nr:40S ribosomal protein S24-2 [Camellia lanceoleosa]